jgi:AraC family transcriptional regulator
MEPAVRFDGVNIELEARYSFGGLRFEEVRYVSGFETPLHAHEQDAFLDLCLSGTSRTAWEKGAFLRGPSTLNFIPPGAPHANHFQENSRTFQIVLTSQWLQRIQQVAPVVETFTNYQAGLPLWIAARIYREFQRQDNLTPLALEGLVLELVAEMSRHDTVLNPNDCPRWLRQAHDFLHAEFTNHVSIHTVATVVGVHPSHLMRGFRQYYDCSIGEYVRRLRVEYACHLLSDTDTFLSEIALSAGFADQSHFNRTFKDRTGMTPVEFRNISGRAHPRK